MIGELIQNVWLGVAIITIMAFWCRSFHPTFKRIYYEIRWNLVGYFLYSAILDHGMFAKVVDWIYAAVYVWVFIHDKDDDDRWRKRRKKIVEKVTVINGRLVVANA